MLNAHAERLVEFTGNVQCRIGILYIVVRQLLAAELLSCGEGERLHLCAAVELGLLVRVLTVAEALLEVVLQEEFLIQAGLGAHIGGNGHIVLGSVGIGLGGKGKPCLAGRVAGGLYL